MPRPYSSIRSKPATS